MSERPLSEADRRRYVSVAVSFGHVDTLERLGSGALKLRCPSCAAEGVRYGNPGEDFRFEGFTPLTAGGLLFILVECDRCKARVTLSHRRA